MGIDISALVNGGKKITSKASKKNDRRLKKESSLRVFAMPDVPSSP